ncbi:hypothetical protein [Clostridium coskatii]|uniref:Uncharacterized protein n=1 Tax=Clostridium coskatii TaxID=1705578 RepID=A0A162L9U2_9CLOT|nr:hypothetical protein [Clostridium coskatii]OAA90706.1 hypothetical protein WX73_02071 [Clostridium coskatii]OBR97458.1 hypothetical protein CLCOS_03140 [Clostridium coskatii]
MAEEKKKEKLLKRNLKTSDLFSFTRIIKKMNMKKELKEIAKDVTGKTEKEKKQALLGLRADLMLLFIENIGNAEQEIYRFLGNLSDKEAQEIADQPPKDTFAMLNEIMDDESFGDFLSTALK